ncbi:hypothetical protein [Rhodoferax saidenbachensis]|uniref:Lipoprotein n=1 Tax=Rhodoferax saidenbachensis TaxID=1484693 RepID=A0ABU1ZMW2_9BURK|nr:hypothetical protein [Rhodoferax saidenbachensis]MDR7306868.1 hypothetical protein [Rhodoferax saidenbachensis]
MRLVATAQALLPVLGLAVLSACSPALNWRQASVASVPVMLPCKPDKARRSVTLVPHTLVMDMVGCEAGSALFAVSRVELPEGVAAPEVLAAWRAQALAALRASQVQDQPMAGATLLQAQGLRPDGRAVQAQLLWRLRGRQIVHWAVYAERLGPDMTEPFFAETPQP